jgi:hypothetical protein
LLFEGIPAVGQESPRAEDNLLEKAIRSLYSAK